MAKSKKKKTEVPEVQNFVAKHAGTFNKAQVFTDRKKDSKNGKIKHKGRHNDASFDVSKVL